MAAIYGKEYSRRNLLRHLGDIRQLTAAIPFELTEGPEQGTRCVRLYNAAGIDMDVLCDRGMSIGRCTYKGIPIAMETATGPVHPAFGDARDRSWLSTWPAGLLTTCGLTQVGDPCKDNGIELGLHGRASTIPARNVYRESSWDGDDYKVSVTGLVHETVVARENIAMTRKIQLTIDRPEILIEDIIENKGFTAVPFMLLHHINIGFPYLQEGTRIVMPRHSTEYTEAADDACNVGSLLCCEPQVGHVERLYYHDIDCDEDGSISISLISPNGMYANLDYKKKDFPFLVQSMMMSEGLYAVGLEPANCHVEGRTSERLRGTLDMLEADEQRIMRLKIRFG